MKFEENEEIVFEGILRNDSFTIINDPEGLKVLSEKGYGLTEGNTILLDPVETLYLVYKGVIKVKNSNGHILTFMELLKKFSKIDEELWVKFIVYSDLRKRGFIIKKGVAPLTLFVDKRGEKGAKRYFVVCLKEGVRVGFSDLEYFFRRAMESDRELVTAIVDKEGNISYYIVERISPLKGD